MEKRIDVGIVGCGYWGPNLIRNFGSLADCSVRAVCDVDRDRLARMTQLYSGAETLSDYDELIGHPEIEAVAIATPVRTHYELARKSLAAGKHTFIEKPMASSTEQCAELIELANANRLTLMVGHTYIYSTPVRKIKEIVDSGDIGKLLYISSQRLNLGLFQKDINVAWDLAPHDLSIILYVMGASPASVSCQGKAYVNPGIEDVTSMSLAFNNGGFATIQNSWLDPNKVRRMTFVGSKRMIFYDDNEPLEKIRVYDKRVEAPPHYDTFAEFHYSYHYGDVHIPYLNQVEPLKTQCQHFLDCIRTGGKPITSGWEGLQVIQVLEAASQSLRKGWIQVEVPDTADIAMRAVPKYRKAEAA